MGCIRRQRIQQKIGLETLLSVQNQQLSQMAAERNNYCLICHKLLTTPVRICKHYIDKLCYLNFPEFRCTSPSCMWCPALHPESNLEIDHLKLAQLIAAHPNPSFHQFVREIFANTKTLTSLCLGIAYFSHELGEYREYRRFSEFPEYLRTANAPQDNAKSKKWSSCKSPPYHRFK